jgi:hypothetical protein
MAMVSWIFLINNYLCSLNDRFSYINTINFVPKGTIDAKRRCLGCPSSPARRPPADHHLRTPSRSIQYRLPLRRPLTTTNHESFVGACYFVSWDYPVLIHFVSLYYFRFLRARAHFILSNRFNGISAFTLALHTSILSTPGLD